MDLDLIDPEMRRAARFMPAPPVHRGWTLPVMRWLTKIGVRHKLSSGVTVEVRPVGAASVHIYRPPERTSDGAVLWIHGGGFVIGAASMDDVRCSRYALEFGAVVVSVEYRLAPEHPFPAPLDDCFAAWTWMQEHADGLGVDPHRIVVGGESAGGGLAATLVQRHPRHRRPAAGGAAARLPHARRSHRRPHRTRCRQAPPVEQPRQPRRLDRLPRPRARTSWHRTRATGSAGAAEPPGTRDRRGTGRPDAQSPSTPSGAPKRSRGSATRLDRRRRGRPVPRRGPRLRRATRGRGRAVRVRRRTGCPSRLRQHGIRRPPRPSTSNVASMSFCGPTCSRVPERRTRTRRSNPSS